MWYARPPKPAPEVHLLHVPPSMTTHQATTAQPLSRSSKTPLSQQLEHEMHFEQSELTADLENRGRNLRV